MSSRDQKRVGNKCSLVTYEVLQKGHFNLNVKKNRKRKILIYFKLKVTLPEIKQRLHFIYGI